MQTKLVLLIPILLISANTAYAQNESQPYKIGYAAGQNDSLISINNFADACKQFASNILAESGPYNSCVQGYGDAEYANKQSGNNQSMTSASDNNQSAPYQTGYQAGLVKGDSTICNQFDNRSAMICSKAHDNAVLSLPWSKVDVYNQGFQYGQQAAKNSGDSDEAGDCSFDPFSAEKQKVCMSGWSAGFDAGKK